MNTDRLDLLIQRALTPDERVVAPASLGDDIERAVAATRQRSSFGARWLVLRGPSPLPALLWLMLIALLVLAGVGAALSLLKGGPPAIPTYHGGAARTGVMPGPGPAGSPVPRWTAQLGGAVPFTIMPLVADGSVVLADDSGVVTALDAATGTTLWQHRFDWPVHGTPVIVDDLLIAASDGGDVVALDLANGRPRWATPVKLPGAVVASLAEIDGVVYAGAQTGRAGADVDTLFALDATTGVERWRFDTAGQITRGPAIADGVIYQPSGGHLQAVDAHGGRLLWDRLLGDGEVGTPAVLGDTVYVGSGLHAAGPPHQVVALATVDGSERWRFSPASGEQPHVAAVDEEAVYLNAEDGFVYALDRRSADLRWQFDTGTRIGTMAALVDGVLYLTNDAGRVLAIDAADGTPRWTVDAADGTPTMPAVIDGLVYVGTGFGEVIALGDPP
jgi:eukaryotic-like serine/threonine-protein kinase